ncbi:MAG: enoyl-CoA hydratase/isomerase family protein [Opitutaceae bacterium]|nr:enoyl-CoA hydratase/isomerase family protein [Opitutaceae bacterium]
MSQLPVTTSIDADGVGWITFDDPGSRANAFNPPMLAALREAIAGLEGAAGLKAVVLVSAKEKIFIAGADLRWIAALPDAAAAAQLSREGQELFGRLAALKVPVVAAIHGACAGGGFELALAGAWRVASDAKETTVGLPEVGVGLIPGWGGCVRLPRLVGAAAAAGHILKAALVPAADALKAGLVDELAPAAELRLRAKAAALRLAAAGLPVRAVPPAAPAEFFATQRRTASGRFRGQPAAAALDVIERGGGLPEAEALRLETERFAGLATGEAARNLIRVFFLKEAGRKATLDAWFAEPAPAAAEPFRIVGVIGAGVMGSGIAQWCASRGLGVILCDTDREAIERGITAIRGLFKQAEERGQLTHDQAHRMMGGIGVSTSLEDFDVCDLVIEAIVENVAEKQKLMANLAKIVGPDCVVASNTSALPLEELAAPLPHPGRVVGLHFFNPVNRMPLVELVLGPHTSRATAERALAFVKSLGKTPVVCRSSPGFFVTRVLFFYLNEACRLWEQGVPTEAIDAAMREWGWPMGPMRLIDEVGIDVTDFIFGEMQHYFPDRFVSTSICRRMLTAGMKGRKNGNGIGFYSYADDPEKPNPAMTQFVPVARAALEAGTIVERLNGVLVGETRRVLAEGVLKTPDDADLALLLGAGFPAVRGGLMRPAAGGQ